MRYITKCSNVLSLQICTNYQLVVGLPLKHFLGVFLLAAWGLIYGHVVVCSTQQITLTKMIVHYAHTCEKVAIYHLRLGFFIHSTHVSQSCLRSRPLPLTFGRREGMQPRQCAEKMQSPVGKFVCIIMWLLMEFS